MEPTMQEWMDQFPNDPGVKAIKAAIATRGKVIVDAPQPLTAMAAQSVAEMLAYSHLLASKPDAMPADVAAAAVAEQKGRIISTWKALSPETRSSVAGTPGLWVTMRALLQYGNADDQSKARDRILQMTDSSASTSAQGTASGSSKIVSGIIQHNTLMMMQQQTFNTYMWSRGFNYSALGKMW